MRDVRTGWIRRGIGVCVMAGSLALAATPSAAEVVVDFEGAEVAKNYTLTCS